MSPREREDGRGYRAPRLRVVPPCPPSWRARVPHKQGVVVLLPRAPVVGHTLALNGGKTHSPTWAFPSGSWDRWLWEKRVGGYINAVAES